MHVYATERLNLHKKHIDAVDIRSVLARQQELTALHHERGDVEMDDEAFAAAESAMQLKKKQVTKKEHQQQLQVVFTENEDGTRNYVVSDLNDDKSQYRDAVYVKPNCAPNEQVLYR
jgi:hypothetical protein